MEGGGFFLGLRIGLVGLVVLDSIRNIGGVRSAHICLWGFLRVQSEIVGQVSERGIRSESLSLNDEGNFAHLRVSGHVVSCNESRIYRLYTSLELF
jgi:hypothetical protein